MTPDDAIAILRRHRESFAARLTVQNVRLNGTKKDERKHLHRQVEALDIAIVSISLMNRSHSATVNKETLDADTSALEARIAYLEKRHLMMKIQRNGSFGKFKSDADT